MSHQIQTTVFFSITTATTSPLGGGMIKDVLGIKTPKIVTFSKKNHTTIIFDLP